jgi:molybdopterin-containing oxidoreductase family membrane subunit
MRSPLIWDFFAVFTYFTVSLLFWYTGLIPDLATLRDRAKTNLKRKIYGFFALGWRGGNRQWQHYELAYLVLAGISTPLVLSVHSVVSSDFATSVIPGWHTTIFPPYFVAGAIYSGFGMVMTLSIIARKVYNLGHIITLEHLDKMAQIMLLTGCMVGYAYSMEFFVAWYSGNAYESFAFVNRALGPYWWGYWAMIFCNVVVPQFFWFERYRRHIPFLFITSILVNIGMWFERFVIVVITLHRDFMPGAWAMYNPTIFDVSIYIGTFGLFFTGFLLFLRFLPMVSIAEAKLVLPESNPHHGHEE